MTNVIQNVYPKDLTMSLPSNHIEREVKVFTTAADRIFVPDGGPFFSQSLIIKDSNGVDLKPQVDYKLLYLNEGATLESGRDVVAVIWVMTETIPSVTLDYRVVGGDFGNTVNAIMQEINKAGPIQKNVDWNVNVYGKPHEFPPAPHFHTPDTFTGWNMVYEQLDGIRKAIISGDDVSWEAHYNYINRLMSALTANLNYKLDNYATLDNLSGAIAGVDATVDLSNYYTKSKVDDLVRGSNDTAADVADDLSANYYTKSASDGRYSKKGDSYTKSQSDGKYSALNASYTKSESDSRYLTSVSLNGYLTTTAANQMESRINNKINEAALSGPDVDLSNYYTRSQVYSKSQTYSKSELDSKVSTLTQEVEDLSDAVDDLTSEVNNYVHKYRIVNKSGNYTAVSADLKGDTILRCTSSSSSTITLPAIGNGMEVGHTINIRRVGQGSLTIKAASGALIYPNDSLSLRRIGSTATLVYLGDNIYDIITELD